jgi:hypothetical protein
MGLWKGFWNLPGFTQRGKSESGLRLECGGGRVGLEACGHRLDA